MSNERYRAPQIDTETEANSQNPQTLHEAAQQGNIDAVQRFLMQPNIDPTEPDQQGNTPLMVALAAGQAATARSLLAHYTAQHTQHRNLHGESALVLNLLHGGGSAMTRTLLENGAQAWPQAIAEHAELPNPLLIAVTMPDAQHLAALLSAAPDLALENYLNDGQQNALAIAASLGYLAHLKILNTHNRSFDQMIHAADEGGFTACDLAAQNNHLDCLKYLIENGADVSSETLFASIEGDALICMQTLLVQYEALLEDELEQALLTAASAGASQCLNALLETYTYDYRVLESAFLNAVEFGQTAILKRLLIIAPSLSYTASDRDGNTAIIKSVIHGQLDSLNFLLECPVNVLAESDAGYTAMHFLAVNTQLPIEIIRAMTSSIVAHTPDAIFWPNRQHLSPLGHLNQTSEETEDIMQLTELSINADILIEHGASHAREEAPLHYAAANGQLILLRYMLLQTSELMNRRWHNRCLIHHAILHNQTAVALWLIEQPGMRLNGTYHFQENLLHHALKCKNVAVAKRLIDIFETQPSFRGMLSAEDAFSQTPMMVALDTQQPDMAAYLFQQRTQRMHFESVEEINSVVDEAEHLDQENSADNTPASEPADESHCLPLTPNTEILLRGQALSARASLFTLRPRQPKPSEIPSPATLRAAFQLMFDNAETDGVSSNVPRG